MNIINDRKSFDWNKYDIRPFHGFCSCADCNKVDELYSHFDNEFQDLLNAYDESSIFLVNNDTKVLKNYYLHIQESNMKPSLIDFNLFVESYFRKEKIEKLLK